MWYNTSDMKKSSILFAAFLAMTASVANAITQINVNTAGTLANAFTTVNSSTTDVEVRFSGTITPTSPTILINNSNEIKIYLTGPAVVNGTLAVSSLSKASVFVSGVTFTSISGKVTILEDEDATAFPEETVAIPSSQRQVYFGFPALKGVTAIEVKKSADGVSWDSISEDKLERRNESSPEPTQIGWQSIRYLDATPNEKAHYKLVATAANGTFESKVFEITTAPKGVLHSRPNAKATIYLDFDGYVDDYKGNAAAANLSYIKTPEYANRKAIPNIWRSVAEDFAIFDVDVTTEEPTIDKLVKSDADDEIYGKRVVFDPRTGDDKWYVGAGGVSGLGAFGFRADRPAFVFGETTDNVACQATHEVSHTLGLVHDGGDIYIPPGSEEYNPETGKWEEITEGYFIESEYYTGQRVSFNCTWYPVMGGVPTNDGADYINQFSNGNYDSATTFEDDFAVITGNAVGAREENVVVFPESLYPVGEEKGFWKLNLLPDDVGNDVSSATPYDGERMALISPNDVDVFSISAKAGELTIKVSPEYEGSSYGSSLDAMVELLDKDGKVLASSENPLQGDIDDGEFRKAELEYTLSQDGVYYIRVSGTYHDVKYCANTNYGSVGPYKLTADYTANEIIDYILISPSDFVNDWTDYIEARKAAHPELNFLVKDASEIYAAYEGETPADKIKAFIREQAAKGTEYFVLGGAWSDTATIENSDISFVVDGEHGDKYGFEKLSLNNTIPGRYHTFQGKTLASDYDYALLDDDFKPDVVVSRIPLVRYPDTTTGAHPTFAEIIAGYASKVAQAEADGFAGRHCYACVAGKLGASVARGDALWPTEPHCYADGYFDFKDPLHLDSAMDGEIAARRRFRDFFAQYNPVYGAAVVPMGTTAGDFFNGYWEAVVAKSHGLEGSAYETGVDEAHFRQSTKLIKFGIFAMPCLTGRPDCTSTTFGEKCLCPSMGISAICNPNGGEVVGFHNTHDGAGKNDVGLVTTNGDPYATQYEGLLLSALCKNRLNAGEAWKAAHTAYIEKFGTGTWDQWTAYESILYGDPLIKLSNIRDGERVKGLGIAKAPRIIVR